MKISRRNSRIEEAFSSQYNKDIRYYFYSLTLTYNIIISYLHLIFLNKNDRNINIQNPRVDKEFTKEP